MQKSPIQLFKNCTILCIDKKNTIAEAMAISEGKILAVGTLSDVQAKLRGDAPIKVDMKGACIVPGFIDAHMHPGMYIYFKTQLDVSGVRGYAVLNRILQAEDKKRKEGEWILGVDLMEDLFEDPAERHFPTRWDLDKACPARPVVVIRHDGHICSTNSPALAAMGIDRAKAVQFKTGTGEIRVDAAGEPTGIFTEGATNFPLANVPMPNMDRLKDAGGNFSRDLAAFGITTVGGIFQLGAEGIAGEAGAVEMALMELLIKDNVIDQDIVFYMVTGKPKQLKRVERTLQRLSGDSGRFVLGGIKLYSDGSFGARTAAMNEPYSDSLSGECGFMVKDHDTLYALVKETNELGYQVITHAIGDKANRLVVDVYKEVLAEHNKPHRYRIEHASTLTTDTMADAARLGIIIASQPAFINSEFTWLERRLGPDRVKQTYPFKSIIDAGIVLAGASDAPVESANVLKALQACVTRHGLVKGECIGVMDAIRVFTWNAAYALNQEKSKGSIEPGKIADFIVLDKNPAKVPSDAVEKIKLLATYQRGKKIYP
nr:amidohydrolase [Candidatus Sigynarchaeota archaeon]